jgi:hypothetical protein
LRALRRRLFGSRKVEAPPTRTPEEESLLEQQEEILERAYPEKPKQPPTERV